ncbi:MAG: TonB-dependent receptor [bacterium]|nr:TonB-dependent receptor [bacterium]
MRALVQILALAVVALLVSSGAIAQQAEYSTPPDHDLYYMAEITVNAEAPRTEAAQKTTVTAEDIKAQNARTVAEALTFAAGISVSTGRKNEPNVSIHGFDQSKILVLIDGVPYYETNYGKLDLNQIPTDNIARIEVTKGAASVLYGANAMGGVVNIITKKASAKPYTGAMVEAGENGLRQFALTHGQKLGKISYWASYSHNETDGWDVSNDYQPIEGTISYRSPKSRVTTVLQEKGRRTNSDVSRDSAWFKIGYENDANSAYWINLHYLDMTKGLPPSTDEVKVFQSRPAFSQIGRMPDYRDRGIDLDVRQRLSSNLMLKGKLFYHDHQDHYDSYRDIDYEEKLARSTFKDSLTGGSVLLESPLGRRNTARLSLNYKTDTHRERDDTYLPFALTESTTGSVGFEDEFKISEKARAVVGVSYDWFGVSSAERNILNDNGDFVEHEELDRPTAYFLNPMAGITYSLSEHGQLFASAARKSRFPLLQQLYSSKSGNVALEPERSTNFVTGYNNQIASNLHLDLSAFWYEISDLISRSGVDPTNDYQNYGKVRMRGIELEVTINVNPSLLLRGNLTFNDAEDRSAGRVTNKVAHVPGQQVGIGLRWVLPSVAARLDLDGLYMGDVYTSLPSPRYPDDPHQMADSYFLMHVRAGIDLAPKLELWGAVRNVFDVDYAPEYGYPGPGRSISVGLSARL